MAKSCFPTSVQCVHEWRPYQKRVLDSFDRHIADRHFHVVAAPGSGKTILGLELLRRLGHPTLVFVPSLAIRDQWIQRFLGAFLRTTDRPDWVSASLDDIQPLTVTTYQALHTLEKRDAFDEFLKRCQQAGIKTIVFDEAHHLRKEWWRVLLELKEHLSKPYVVSLTATPPFDVGRVEWNRYIKLCGEIDAEVSVPELVKEGNLCPHQDYVYLSLPSASEEERLKQFDQMVRGVLADLALDQGIIQAVGAHPVLAEPAANIDTLLKQTDYYLSLAVFLKHATGLSPARLIKQMGLKDVEMPAFHRGWATIFLNGILFQDRQTYATIEPTLKLLQKRLHAAGAIHHRTVQLRRSPHNNQMLRASPAKLYSIANIIEHECRIQGWKMSAVILTDYIREEDFPNRDGIEHPPSRLGVVPIFEHLRRLRLPDVRLGIATGRLVVVPREALEYLQSQAQIMGIGEVTGEPLWHDGLYYRVRPSRGEGGALLPALTQLLKHDYINVLVGTSSLLGEGWDAPAINTLVLATTIGTYISSNQMRGRAIRTNPADAFKAANIWHLAAVVSNGTEEDEEGDESEETTRDDLSLLQRRFDGFVGLHGTEPSIESGLTRLGAISPIRVDAWNARMCREAEQRGVMAERWQQAIQKSPNGIQRVADELVVPIQRLPAHPIVRNWWWQEESLFPRLRDWLLKRRFRSIALLVLRSLNELGVFTTKIREKSLDIRRQKHCIAVRLLEADTRDEMLFSRSFSEVFEAMEQVRYLLVGKRDTYVVPAVLADRKEKAEAFARRWVRMVEPVELVYVHSEAGKVHLLKAREKQLSKRHGEPLRRRRRWI
jgi:superfamily II DNA or RNA helicase